MRWRGRRWSALPFSLPVAPAEPTGAAPIVRGDANGDGVISAVDALAVLSSVVGRSLPPGWAADPNGDVDCSGAVTALDALVILSATVGRNVSAFCLGQIMVMSLSVVPDSVDVAEGDSVQLSATPRDSNGDALPGRLVTWASADTLIIRVGSTGMLHGVAVGTALVIAECEGRTDTVTVVVSSGFEPATSLDVTPAEAAVLVGGSVELRAIGRDASGRAVPVQPTWISADTAVARVDSAGRITGVRAGSAWVRAVHEALSDSAWITVAASASPTVVWVGGASGNETGWEDARNWDPGTVPGAADTALVPAGAGFQPIAGTSSPSLAGLVVDEGAVVTVASGRVLTVSGVAQVLGAVGGAGEFVLAGSARVLGTLPAVRVTGSDVTLIGDVSVAAGLTLASDARLTVAGYRLDIGAGFTQTLTNSSRGLTLDSRGGVVVVEGDAHFAVASNHGSATTASNLLAGDLYLHGDLLQTTAYSATGRSFVAAGTRVVFDGSGPQSVSFATPGMTQSHFADVHVANTVGVTLSTNIAVTGRLTLSKEGRLVQSGSLEVAVAGHLPDATTGYQVNRTRVSGSIVMDRPVTFPNAGNHLYIEGGYDLTLAGQQLEVGGNLVQTITNDPTSGLVMTDAQDEVTVNGNATFAVASYNGSATTAGTLPKGVIRVRGHFTQSGAYASSGSSFVSSGTRVVFDGVDVQNVSFGNPGEFNSRFMDLTVSNAVGVQLTSNVWAMGRATLEPGAALNQTGSGLYVTTTMPVAGSGYGVQFTYVDGRVVMDRPAEFPDTGNHVIVRAGRRLELASQSLLVGGDLTVYEHNDTTSGLYMVNPLDSLTVEGKTTFAVEAYNGSATSAGHLTEGVIRMRGDFVQASAYASTGLAFVATGTRVVFDGTSPQSVSFSNPSATHSHFHHADAENPAGVTFLSHIWATGRVRIIGSGVLHQSEDQGLYLVNRLPDPSLGYDVMNTRTGGGVLMDRPSRSPIHRTMCSWIRAHTWRPKGDCCRWAETS